MNKQALTNILHKFFVKKGKSVVFASSKTFFSNFDIKFDDFIYDDLEVLSYLTNTKVSDAVSALSLLKLAQMEDCYEKVEKIMPAILAQMERVGLKVNTNKLELLRDEILQNINSIQQEIYVISGKEFNINSPKQVNEVLFTDLKLKTGKKTAGGENFSTNADVLEDLAFEGAIIAQKLIEARHLYKLLNTYIDVFLEKASRSGEGRIHTTFSSTTTLTGRLNSKNPNLQNLPTRTEIGSKIKACFEGRAGFSLVSFDYSQIELRILAHIADVAPLKEAFNRAEDIHAKTASTMFGVDISNVTPDLRNNAKAINFGIIYGLSAFALAKTLKVSTAKAGEYMEAYFNQYSGIKKYMEETKEYALKNHFVRTILGKKCYLEGITSSNYTVKSHAIRAAINARIQGSAADLIKQAMVNIVKSGTIDDKCQMVLQIHDELVFEVENDVLEDKSRQIKNLMENAILLSVPIIVNSKIFNKKI